MKRELIINGNNFNNLNGFYDEVEKNFTKDLEWKIGRNLDAFNDVLRGGFGVHEYGEPIIIKWINFKKSLQDFGYPATQEYFKRMLKKCHPSNVPYVEEKMKKAYNRTGETLIDLIVEIIMDTDNSDHDCILEKVD